MQNADIIRTGISYIEQNLKTDITPEELANMAGYSVWHYQRMFAQTVGVPLAAYINRRRLDRALAEICSKRKATDAALEYGFESYAGFYKAFLRTYGCSPKKYLSIYGTHKSLTEVLTMRTEKELRRVLKNWDVPQDMTINDVRIADGTRTANNIWQVGKDYILKTEDRAALLRNARVAKAMAKHGLSAAVPVPTINGGEVSGFADFELSERNVRLWDPCYCAAGILSEQHDVENAYDKFPEILEAVLHGYNSEAP